MNPLWHVRLALRTFRRQPAFLATALATLTLGFVAATTIFGVVHAVLLRPLPFHEPDRLAIVWEVDRERHLPVVEISHRAFTDWRREIRAFEAVAAVGSSSWSARLEDRGDPRRVSYAAVSANFFDLLGARPMLGRTFTPEDDERGAARTLVLAHGFWQQHLGGDAGIVGQTMRLDGEPFLVAGVMPPDFTYPRGAEMWTPIVPVLARASQAWNADLLESRAFGVLYVLGRLAPGATREQARLELEASLWHQDDRPEGGAAAVSVRALREELLGNARPALLLLAGTVAVVLLIACANVAGLLLARSAARRRERAIQLALGAGRWTLARQWLTEAVLLALGAAAAGLWLAHEALRVVVRLAPADVPGLEHAGMNAAVFAAACGMALLSGVICVVPAALQDRAGDIAASLKAAGGGTDGPETQRWRRALVVGEVALATVLLVGASLLVRSFVNLRQLDLGFQPAGVLTLDVEPLVEGDDRVRLFDEELLERLRSLPGVEAAGAVFLRPLAHGPIGLESTVLLEGQPPTPEAAAANPMINLQSATPGYFETLRVPLAAGRVFEDADGTDRRPVAIVSESAARLLWPGEPAVGKRLSLPVDTIRQKRQVWRTVVGVVRDVRYRGLDDLRLDVYVPPVPSHGRAKHFFVRTSGDPLAAAAAVRTVAAGIGPPVVIQNVRTLDSIVDEAMAPWRFNTLMFLVLGGTAWLLALVGLFGLMAYLVIQSRRAIAVRVALGAESRDVVRLVLRQGMAMAAAGLALGTVAALALAHLMSRLLFGVDPVDGVSFAGAALVLGAGACLATYLPARRAARTDPAVLFRSE